MPGVLSEFCRCGEERRRAPKDDLISELIEAEIDGARVDQDMLLGICLLLLLAGSGSESPFSS